MCVCDFFVEEVGIIILIFSSFAFLDCASTALHGVMVLKSASRIKGVCCCCHMLSSFSFIAS